MGAQDIFQAARFRRIVEVHGFVDQAGNLPKSQMAP
jgi:hypothetical protein